MQMPSKGISSKKQQKKNRETAGCTGDLSRFFYELLLVIKFYLVMIIRTIALFSSQFRLTVLSKHFTIVVQSVYTENSY